MRKHYVLPDLQIKPGVPTDHIDWIAQDIVRRKPTNVIVLGDGADFPSLSFYDAPGSLSREGARYEADVEAFNEAFERLARPIHAEIERLRRQHLKRWEPQLDYLDGNHEDRVRRAVEQDPKWAGTIRDDDLNITRMGFVRHPFLKVIQRDGINYTHYFQSEKSRFPIGGTMDNRINKIGASFVCGHEQGLLTHRRPLPVGCTIYGVVAGSCYLHQEEYRRQRNNEWRGTLVLNDVRDGGYDIMELNLRYLCERYTGEKLVPYMNARYPGKDWSYLDK